MKQARVLTQKELKQVFMLCDASQHGQRNKLAVMLSHYAGLRVGEIASLIWADLLDRDQSVKAVFLPQARKYQSQ